MTLRKAVRRWIASSLVAVFVGLQLAAAAYACAGGSGDAASAPAVLAMAAMPDCAEMGPSPDHAQPQLCKAHCDQDKQSVNTAPAASLAAAQIVDWLFSRLLQQQPLAVAEPAGVHSAAPPGPPQGAPPVYLAYLVLRN